MIVNKLSKTEIEKYKLIFETSFGELKYTSVEVKSFIINKLKESSPKINFNEIIKSDNKFTIRNRFFLTNMILNEDFHKELYDNFLVAKITNKITEEKNDDIDDDIFEMQDNTYILNKEFTNKEIQEIYYRSAGFFKMKYDFNKSKLKTYELDTNINSLQRVNITILQNFGTFNEFARLEYRCPKCGKEFLKGKNDIESNDLVKCPFKNVMSNKMCNGSCKTPTNNSDKFNMYIYQGIFTSKDLITKKEKDNHIIIFSHLELNSIEYDSIVLSLSSNQKQYLQILDAKPIINNILDFTELYELKPEEDKDLVYDTVKFFDSVIKKLSRKEIHGIMDIKFALLRQKLAKYNGLPLHQNIALRGDKGTGKTMIVDKYCILLYNNLYKSTKGTNTSVPALRGSAIDSISHNDTQLQPPGLLSIYHAITIDEANSDPFIVKYLRGMLLSSEISNDKAGGSKIIYSRTAHVNITENVSSTHQSKYKAIVKKEFDKISNAKEVNIGESIFNQLSDWKNDWDLMQPLSNYTNKKLRESLKEARKHSVFADIHWLYGCDMPDLDRFCVNFYIRNTHNEKLKEIIGISTIKDYYSKKNKKNLFVGNIDEIFEYYKQFNRKKTDVQTINKIRKILLNFFEGDINSRLELNCYFIADCSRIFNKRMHFNEIDIGHVKRFISLTNRAIDLEEMNSFIYPKTMDEGININKKGIQLD
ncbi:MAG: hypothetical protein KAX49_14435 [Halanaerobiales bacterium]|nr:hypothetical protein [Halanaerobiales bacterium]